jgi:hypothetical protein
MVPQPPGAPEAMSARQQKWRTRVCVAAIVLLLCATLRYEVYTELGPPESARRWVRVVPAFIDSASPIEPGGAKYSVIREQWSLFGFVHQKKQIIFVCRF